MEKKLTLNDALLACIELRQDTFPSEFHERLKYLIFNVESLGLTKVECIEHKNDPTIKRYYLNIVIEDKE